MSSEKISYLVFFVVALAVVSIAVYVEKPESLASAIPWLEDDKDDAENSGDIGNDQSTTIQDDADDSGDEAYDSNNEQNESTTYDNDQTNNDMNTPQSEESSDDEEPDN